MDKICPIRSPHPNTSFADRDTSCVREECAWWCPEPPMSTETNRCAIRILALAQAQKAFK